MYIYPRVAAWNTQFDSSLSNNVSANDVPSISRDTVLHSVRMRLSLGISARLTRQQCLVEVEEKSIIGTIA